ncbi:MAG: signal recognition particle subunit SRP19/SEC65 family protein [Candidatus Thermoplasmatota archaeon]
MVSKDIDKYVVWPIYFDKNVSRKLGRKVSKKQAVENPKAEDVVKAAKKLDLQPVLEKNKRYPSHHWKKTGRVLVEKKWEKSKTLKKIANRL